MADYLTRRPETDAEAAARVAAESKAATPMPASAPAPVAPKRAWWDFRKDPALEKQKAMSEMIDEKIEGWSSGKK